MHASTCCLIDGKLPLGDYVGKQQTVVKGDDLCFSIAAASILAKEARDGVHASAGRRASQQYGFDAHVGYGTSATSGYDPAPRDLPPA